MNALTNLFISPCKSLLYSCKPTQINTSHMKNNSPMSLWVMFGTMLQDRLLSHWKDPDLFKNENNINVNQQDLKPNRFSMSDSGQHNFHKTIWY